MNRRLFLGTTASAALLAGTSATAILSATGSADAATGTVGAWRRVEVTMTASPKWGAGAGKLWLPAPMETPFQRVLGVAWAAGPDRIGLAYDPIYRAPAISSEWAAGKAREVQVIPSNEVITRLPEPLEETDAKRLSSGDHATDCQSLSAEGVRVVQVIPSGEVITRFVPALATATKSLSSEDQATDCHPISYAGVRVVHVIPSGLVITRFVPESATATKS